MHAAPLFAVVPPVGTGDASDGVGAVLATGTDLGVSLAAVVVLGVGAQWIASRLGVPSILLLLVAGVVAGPDVTGLVDTDAMLGDLLFPAVSLAVGILLFEGGLGLRVRELGRQGAVPIVRLVTVGAAATWAIGALAAHQLVGLDRNAAILLGAILVVSGPTVVTPLLRFARVREPVNRILRWEGIVIDPIGATLGLVVVSAMTATETTWTASGQVVTTAATGVVVGALGAAALTFMFDRQWVPDELHNPFTLAVVAAAFAAADGVRPEAGLFATTAMGVAMGNQRRVPTAHIRDFEEDLGTLILAGLFIVLGARVELDLLGRWAPEALLLIAVLVLVARPVTVGVSTAGGSLSWRERAYLCCMAPRGIVAAAVSALFALRLERAGEPVEALVPVTFMVIVGTVVIYGLAARPMAVRLRVARPDPRGLALIGGPRWALELGEVLSENEVPVLVVTHDPLEATGAAARGLFTYTRRLDAEDLRVALDSLGVAVAIATSHVQELNAYGVTRAIGALGRANVYYLPAHEADDEGEVDIESRRPFAGALTQSGIDGVLARGGRIVALERDAVTSALEDGAGDLVGAITLVTISADGRPTVATGGTVVVPPIGGRGIYLVPGPGEATEGAPVTASGRRRDVPWSRATSGTGRSRRIRRAPRR